MMTTDDLQLKQAAEEFYDNVASVLALQLHSQQKKETCKGKVILKLHLRSELKPAAIRSILSISK
jgi:hypothetical protein